MRDPKRIDRIIDLIRKIWKKNSDLRLCHLIGNCFLHGDLYHQEDDDLEKRLKEKYLTEKYKGCPLCGLSKKLNKHGYCKQCQKINDVIFQVRKERRNNEKK